MAPAERGALMALASGIARQRGLAVLFTEHDMDVVFAIADRIMVLHQGRVIADGEPAEVRADALVQRVYLGEEDDCGAPRHRSIATAASACHPLGGRRGTHAARGSTAEARSSEKERPAMTTETYDWDAIVNGLNQYLRLRSIPIGMKLFETVEAMEAIPKIRRPRVQAHHGSDRRPGAPARLDGRHHDGRPGRRPVRRGDRPSPAGRRVAVGQAHGRRLVQDAGGREPPPARDGLRAARPLPRDGRVAAHRRAGSTRPTSA